ncbi:MAG: ACP S-malonyltransferase [Chloroflexi bacterium]|nr:ACP S-malonyltransferase [Chloroflexota bacterium]
MTIALVFPGQGSQFVGMGKDLLAFDPARAVFEEADRILGFALSRVMFDGPKEELDDTVNTQPALFAMSAAVLACLPAQSPAFVAGHSLGEYAALYAAGALSLPDGLRLVRERGRLMKAAGASNPGGMAAIIGLDDAAINELCAAAGGVQVANYNSPGQVVISGTREGVAAVMTAAKQRKAKLVTALDVSIAAHSELMRPAVADFTSAVNATPFHAPRIPVVANITAQPLESVEAVRAELVGQLTASVQWTRTIESMAAHGVDTIAEVGAGKVLSGLNKRIARGARLVNFGDLASIQSAGT